MRVVGCLADERSEAPQVERSQPVDGDADRQADHGVSTGVGDRAPDAADVGAEATDVGAEATDVHGIAASLHPHELFTELGGVGEEISV